MQAFLNIFLMFIHFDKESAGQSKGFIEFEQAILSKAENSSGSSACKRAFPPGKTKAAAKATAVYVFIFQLILP